MNEQLTSNSLTLTNPSNPNDKIRLIYDNNGLRFEKITTTITESVEVLETVTNLIQE